MRSEECATRPNNNCYNGTTPYQCIGSACGYFTQEYAATHRNEWNGILYSNDQWATFLENRVEAQQSALTDLIMLASDDPNVKWIDIYNNLTYSGHTEGGNATFIWGKDLPADSYLGFIPGSGTGGCLWSCRDGDMPSVHMHNDLLHVDTSSPLWGFGLGFFLHGVFDVGIGNINPSVPRIP